MASIRLQSVRKIYANGHVAARGLDLEIADGEFIVLVGPSGCGKSTALRMIAGLESPTDGRIWIGDRDVTDLPAQERDIAMVFQNYALYPHKTVRENLAFGLRMRGASRPQIEERVSAVAKVLDLQSLLDRKPAQLSGGQRQRVALGRAIVRKPKAFLLDEPLSNLDARLRVQTRAELARLHRRLGATMLYVTHDQEEAMTLGDRVAVMHDGRFQQVAPPIEIYRRPANLFVAGFIGSPSMNLLPCVLQSRDGRSRIEGELFTLDAPVPAGDAPRDIYLGIRPQDLEIVPDDQADLIALLEVLEPLGSALLIHARPFNADTADMRILAPPDTDVREGVTIGLRLRRDRLHLFDAETGDRVG